VTNVIKFIKGVKFSIIQLDKEKLRWQNMDKTKFLTLFKVLVHPIETMSDIKFEKRGSLALANLMAFLYFICACLQFNMTGYLFNYNIRSEFSLVSTFATSALILLLWATCNWSTCTLLDGEGAFKEIWMAICYAMLPVVLIQIPMVFLSNMFTLQESMILSAVMNISFLWSVLLIFLGMMTVHQFTVAKTVGSMLITLLIIASVAFLAVLFFSIFQQMIGFCNTVITELTGR